MKKKFLLAALILAAGALLAAGRAFAGISGTTHDFTSKGWVNSSEQICIVCHTPHNAKDSIAPLWNHEVTKAAYEIYSSPSLEASVGQPSSASKACLSCHDGTVATNSFGGIQGSYKPVNFYLLGTDLADDHPVSFTYDTALAIADGGLYDPAAKTVGALGKTIQQGMLIDGKVECSSCHDVHRTKGYSSESPFGLLVRHHKSELCLTCHNK